MSIAAVIVTHNNAGTITACIESLQAQGIAHIIVVDNASTDATAAKLKKLPVAYTQNQKNIGFAAAVNQAIHTITNYIRQPAEQITNYLLLNPDAQLLTSIKPALDHMAKNPPVGIIGLQLQDEQGQLEKYSHGKIVTFTSLFIRKADENLTITGWRRGGRPSRRTYVPAGWVSAGAMLIRRHIFEQLGGFDPTFFMYWEDVDICRRASSAGWQIIRMPAVQVMHRRGTSLKDNIAKTKLYDTSADRYFRKHYATPIWASQHLLRRTYRLFFRQAQ